MTEGINLVLLCALLAIGVYFLILRLSPQAMKRRAAADMARANALEKYREVRHREHRRWQLRLGVASLPPPTPAPEPGWFKRRKVTITPQIEPARTRVIRGGA